MSVNLRQLFSGQSQSQGRLLILSIKQVPQHNDSLVISAPAPIICSLTQLVATELCQIRSMAEARERLMERSEECPNNKVKIFLLPCNHL